MPEDNRELMEAKALLERSGERAAIGDPGYNNDLSRAWFLAYDNGLPISPEVMNNVHRKYNSQSGSD